MRKQGRRSRLSAHCWRCGNEDDLLAIRDHHYCLSCRTCPHNYRYDDFWEPACANCVLALHTHLTFEGPRIRDLTLYVRDALRWGIDFSNIHTWTFMEEEALMSWRGLKNEPFYAWYVDRPPHFISSRESP